MSFSVNWPFSCFLFILRTNKVVWSIVSVRQLTNARSVVSLSRTLETYAMWFVWYQGINNAFRVLITLMLRGAWQWVYAMTKKRRHEKITRRYIDYGNTGKSIFLIFYASCRWFFFNKQSCGGTPGGNHSSCFHHLGMDVCFNEYNYYDSLQASLTAGFGHLMLCAAIASKTFDYESVFKNSNVRRY